MDGHRTQLLGLVMASAVLAGCRGEEAPSESPSQNTSSAIVVDGTPEALGLLEFLNASSTTFATLVDDVDLLAKTAGNLMAHRDGPDGTFGTADDNPFDSVVEVDDVSWVGPVSMQRLLDYAIANGWVPASGDVLGVFDDVTFTVDEAIATLDYVNNAPFEELDDELALDVRAVEAIFDARDITSLDVLADLPYVGPVAMQKLKDAALAPQGPLDLYDACNAHAECASGLCAGLTLDASGTCFESSMAGTFVVDTPAQIPDNASAATSYLEVEGLATVPLDVRVTLDIDHPRPQDLVVTLSQPGGGHSVLWNHEGNPQSVIEAPKGIEGDNMVNGRWTLQVQDTVTGQAGTVNGWSMWIVSNWD